MPSHKAMRRIAELDPERDHQKIMYLVSACEFPFDTTRALEFALYRTYAAVSIGTLLDRTGEFRHRAQKRYDDTDLILSEIVEHGHAEPWSRSDRRGYSGLGTGQLTGGDVRSA